MELFRAVSAVAEHIDVVGEELGKSSVELVDASTVEEPFLKFIESDCRILLVVKSPPLFLPRYH